MTTIGYATLDVIPSLRGAQASLQKQAAGQMSAAGKVGGRSFGDAAGVAAGSSFKTRFASGLKGIAAPLAAFTGAARVANLLKGAISGASDLEESGSKVGVVFGDAAVSVRQFAADASSGLGQSEAQALAATGTFGNLLRAVGLTEEVSADLSTSMVELASDLASFNNTSVDDALEALRSGLVGETEPLKRFGVNLNETTLKAKALELGLSNGKDVLDSNAKAQAAYGLIMEQTALAQGDFARTSDGLANQQKILGAQWSEMTTALGQQLLPAVTGFVSVLNEKGLPALEATGGFVSDAAKAFGSLPGPVQTAAGAFVALRASSAIGLTAAAGSAARSSVASMSGLMDTLRLRTMFAADTFRSASGSGFAATLAGIRAGAAGAAVALRGLAVAVAPIAVITAAVTIWAKFKQGQEEARQGVEDHKAALDELTGALTEQNETVAINALQQSGAFDAAKNLGIGLYDVTQAALGNKDSIALVNSELDKYRRASGDPSLRNSDMRDQAEDADLLADAIGGQNDAVNASIQGWKDEAEAHGKSAEATKVATDAMRDFTGETKDARDKLRDLMNLEKERAEAAIQNRRDRIGLEEQRAAARREAREGKVGLDAETNFGRDNMAALLDLADQFNNSSSKVRNTEGLYADLREEFIRLAEKMGAGEEKAKKLADQLLLVPRTAPLKFQTEGFQKTMDEIAAIKRAAGLGAVSIGLTPHQTGLPSGTNPPPTTPDTGRDADDFLGGRRTGPTTNYYAPVTYTDENEGRKRAQQRHRRAQSDGVRRP